MKTTVPFTKDILFKSKIAEITSISLEHEINIDDEAVNGNFIVSGDYKTHEVSVNKEEFLYKLPFNVELTDNIDLDTFSFEILDFYYEIIDKEILRVNIEFEVQAEEKEVEIPTENKEERHDDVVFENIDEEIENVTIETPLVEERQEIPEDKEEKVNEEEQRISKTEQETILNNIAVDEEEEYINYNVHIVREMESLESICEQYSANIDLVKEYNNVTEINIGDKIIIPQDIDE